MSFVRVSPSSQSSTGARRHHEDEELSLHDLIKHNHGNKGSQGATIGGHYDSAHFSPGSSMSSLSTSSKHGQQHHQQGHGHNTPQHRVEMLHRSSGMIMVEVGTPPVSSKPKVSERNVKHGAVVSELQDILDLRRSKNGETT